jgi:sucrose-6-phosphate hydrolase SacC (GH32 family)
MNRSAHRFILRQRKKWMNDPASVQKEFTIYFINIEDIIWGPMHWDMQLVKI